jgi:Fic family protein
VTWNWQKKDWPNFSYNIEQLVGLENEFLYQAGLLVGVYSHLNNENKNILMIDLLSDEALKTSEIEGEYLNRDSVQSSVKKHFGFQAQNTKIPLAEAGISEMMIDLYSNYHDKLSDELLGKWHRMLTYGRRDIKNLGYYRTDQEAMQVISGPIHNPKVHFAAPPSENIPDEMRLFINWFNDSSPSGKTPLSTLIRASIAHLYFVSIHPFEDGNGRIARGLAVKSLADSLKSPVFITLSTIIEKNKKDYYAMLEMSNKSNEITNWLIYFAKTIIQAQKNTVLLIEFIIKKTKFFDHFANELNDRQNKAILRIFAEGPDGFKGGLSAENYINITKTSRATTTRDLQDLVNKKALIRVGERKSTRYYLV